MMVDVNRQNVIDYANDSKAIMLFWESNFLLLLEVRDNSMFLMLVAISEKITFVMQYILLLRLVYFERNKSFGTFYFDFSKLENFSWVWQQA